MIFTHIFHLGIIWTAFVLAHLNAFIFREYAYPSYHTHYTITREAIAHSVLSYILAEGLPDNKTAVETLEEKFSEDKEGKARYEQALNEIIHSMSMKYRTIYTNPIHLMANELIEEGNAFLIKTRKDIIELSSKTKPNTNYIRQLIGEFLLTQQMFYSNTNWLELKNNQLCTTLGVHDKFDVPLAEADQQTCKNCNDQVEGDCINNLIGDVLTSGYIDLDGSGGVKPLKAGWQENGVGKCSHGGRLDHSRNIPALGGINKETTEYLLSPHNSIHDQSGTVSTQAASQFLVDKENGILHLMGGNALQAIFNVEYTKPVSTTFSSTTNTLGVNGSATPPGIKGAFPNPTTPSIKKPTMPIMSIAEPYCYNCYQASFSLVFVIDDTGSMGDDIRQVLTQAVDIVNKGDFSNPLANYILVTFNDPATTYFETKNSTKMISQLRKINVHGGDDCPEYAFSGLLRAIEHAEKGSCVFLFTDADPKDENLCQNVSDLVNKKDIHLVSFLTGRCSGTLEEGMTSSCITTKQKPFQCNARKRRSTRGGFSSFGGTVVSAPNREITAQLKKIFEKNLNIKYVAVATISSMKANMTFPVDSYIDTLIVEIRHEHSKSNIQLYRPDNKIQLFSGSDTIECVSGGIQKCVLSIKRPIAGMWTLSNHGNHNWSVDIKGQGGIEVKANLMERKFGSLLDIVGRPISGHNISVVAAVAGLNKTAKLEYIVLYSDNYIELTRAPVAVFPDSSVFIAVAEVIVPQQMFTVSIEGRNVHNELDIFQRKNQDTIIPSIASLDILENEGELYRNRKKDLKYLITNYGAEDTNFTIRASKDGKVLEKRSVSVDGDDYIEGNFSILADSKEQIMTINIAVHSSSSGEMIQNEDVTWTIEDTTPPIITKEETTMSCLPESLNFINCSYQFIEANITIETNSEIEIAYTKPKVSDTFLQRITNETYKFRVWSDCCVPKFRVFVKDTNSNLIQKPFDFVAANTFSNNLPLIKKEGPTIANEKPTSTVMRKIVVYSSIGICITFLIVIIGVIFNVLYRRETRRHA